MYYFKCDIDYTFDPWTMWGVGAPCPPEVENLSINFTIGPSYLEFHIHRFNQH